MKEENIITRELQQELEFDGQKIKAIRFDLEHINHGWNNERRDYNPTRRSYYNAENIVEFFEQFKYYSIDWEEGKNKIEVKIRGEKRMRYYAYIYDHDSKKRKKMVVDIPKNFKNKGIIITIY